MITASQKKKENIAEYLIYMWQIEDLIRAYNLDIDLIKANIIDKYTGIDEAKRREITEWYESLIDMMRREGVTEKGHLQLNKNVIIALDDLHRRLLADPKFSDYSAEFYRTLPHIVALRAKSGDEKPGEIEALFNLLYGVLLLRLQGKEVSAETAESAAQASRLLAMLAGYYKKDFENRLFVDEEQ